MEETKTEELEFKRYSADEFIEQAKVVKEAVENDEVKELELPSVPLETPTDDKIETKQYDVDILVGNNIVSVVTLSAQSKEEAEMLARMEINTKVHNHV
jgi:hypothetical protein